MKTRLFLILLCVVNLSFSQIYVNLNATGANDGTSWGDAYTSLQSALTNANSGDEIWVASGTYLPHSSNRSVYFTISDANLKLYGGFAGTETQVSDRVFGTNETILSGDLQGNDVNVSDFASNYSNATRNTDNSYHIINILSTGNNLLLDGFTVSDAHNNLSGTERGGAIIKEPTVSTLTIRNCIIKDNVGRNDNAGVLAEFDMNNANTGARGTLIVENSTFINNMSRWGSGVYSFVRGNSNVDITVVNCLFDTNLVDDLSPTLKGFGGSASWFRALEANAGMNLDLINNTYVNNLDFGTSGGLNNLNRSTVAISEEVTNATISLNATVSNCIFWYNRTSNESITRAISDLNLEPANTHIYNSIDELGFNDFSITSTTNTSYDYPQFVDAVNQDYNLLPTSPGIGTGDNSQIPTGITTDLNNNNRVQQTTVDMGAYESTYSSSFIKTILYVNANASGANNGTSWTDAYNDLQDALMNIESGSEIWIASGTYLPHASNRSVYFDIEKANLKLYGGFAGTETQISDRVYGTNETILSGDLLGNDVNTNDFVSNYSNTTRNGDNSYHVVMIHQSGINLILDGLTISDAHTNLNGTELGGAIVKNVNVPKLILRNCNIKNNVSRNGNAGLFARFNLFNTNNGPNGELIIENSRFVNNMSRYGSAVYSFLDSNTTVDVHITNTLFDNNIAADLSASLKGRSGSASWFRVIQTNSVLNINLVNNTYAKNIDTGTDQSLTNNLRGVVTITRNSLSTGTIESSASNCIFWDNETTAGATSRAFSYNSETQPNSLTIFNSIDELNFAYGMVTGTTNISNSSPMFTDALNNDFTLQVGSPAIDTGDNSFIPSGVTTDLNGNVRIMNGIVDLGVFEYDAPLSTDDNEAGFVFSLYPNPTNDILNIDARTNIEKIEIYNYLGQKILTTSEKVINVNNLKNGIYLLKIYGENNSVGLKRFIKR